MNTCICSIAATLTAWQKGNLQIDNSAAIREAVLAGVGIAVCPVWLFGDLLTSNALSVILQHYQPTSLPIYAVYRRGRFVSAKVRCLIDYLTHEFTLNPWLSDSDVNLPNVPLQRR